MRDNMIILLLCLFDKYTCSLVCKKNGKKFNLLSCNIGGLNDVNDINDVKCRNIYSWIKD